MNIKTIYDDDTDEPCNIDFDNLILFRYVDNSLDRRSSFYVNKKDFDLAKDHKQTTINIDNDLIDVDCEIADLIVRLNKAGRKTKFCCSSHYFSEKWYREKPSYEEYKSKPIILYQFNDKYPLDGGYISFKKRWHELEKIVPLRPLVTKDDGITGYINMKSKNPILYTHNIGGRTALYWWFPKTVDIAKESVEYITKLIEPIL